MDRRRHEMTRYHFGLVAVILVGFIYFVILVPWLT